MYDLNELTFQLVDYGSPQYDQSVGLRDKILRQPLGWEFDVEDLAREHQDHHLCCFTREGELLACLVLTKQSKNVVRMRQVAVDDHLQGKGLGSALVLESEVVALELGFNSMTLHARETAIPFYERLNYKTHGKKYEEVGIPHQNMKKFLVP